MPFFPSAMEMDVNNVNNFNDVRERSHSLSNASSRSTSIVSKASSIPYHERMTINNGLPNQEHVEPIDSSQLSYSSDGQERDYSSMVADLILPQGPQRVSNEALALNTSNVPHVDNDDVINIQLLYDPNRPMEPELWDGNFQHISLYSSLEHLPSDASCIKTSLICMAKYIGNKKIDSTKANEVNDLKGIGEVAWKFVSAF